MTTKLTLSMNPDAIARIKRHAARRKTSVSRLFETYVYEVTASSRGKSATPLLDKWRGCIKGADPEDYKRYLLEKYSK
ncbi:MAG TPA: DUF6364 family protein [Bryobacteraceae bacterium]|nr:DUF6364 family protein [Bryobacteraceae bacterium]HPT28356.1 DUF6364 family protein [Bryobacteraceae bacterium]